MSRQLRPCGTRAAYFRHLRHREVPCDPCRNAQAEAQRDWDARARAGLGPSDPVLVHGTVGGYQKHKRRGQSPCEACAQAWREYQRAYMASVRRVKNGAAT